MVRKASDRPAGSSLHLATCPAPQRPEVRWGAVPMASAGAPGLPRLPPWPPAPLGPLSRRAGCPQGPPFSRPPEQHSPELSPGPDVCTDPGERLAGRGGGGAAWEGPKACLPAGEEGRCHLACHHLPWSPQPVLCNWAAWGSRAAERTPAGPLALLWLSSPCRRGRGNQLDKACKRRGLEQPPPPFLPPPRWVSLPMWGCENIACKSWQLFICIPRLLFLQVTQSGEHLQPTSPLLHSPLQQP